MVCSNTEKDLGEVKANLLSELHKIYDLDTVTTVAELKGLMEKDDRMLLRLSQKAFDDTEATVLKALTLDGVQYPSFIWNREDVGQRIKLPGFVSLSEHAPVISATPPKSKGNSQKKYVGTGICLGGGALAVYALSCDPISLALLAIGVAVLAVGGVTIWKASVEEADSAAGAMEQNETEQIHRILKKQRESCKEILDAWFENVIKLVETAVDQSNESDEGR